MAKGPNVRRFTISDGTIENPTTAKPGPQPLKIPWGARLHPGLGGKVLREWILRSDDNSRFRIAFLTVGDAVEFAHERDLPYPACLNRWAGVIRSKTAAYLDIEIAANAFDALLMSDLGHRIARGKGPSYGDITAQIADLNRDVASIENEIKDKKREIKMKQEEIKKAEGLLSFCEFVRSGTGYDYYQGNRTSPEPEDDESTEGEDPEDEF